MEVLAFMSMTPSEYQEFMRFENGKMNPELETFFEEVAKLIE